MPEWWWAQYARVYDWLWAGRLTDELAGALRKAAGAVPGACLDAGTGTGLVATRTFPGSHVIGMDRSPAMIARAATRPGSWLLGDAREPPFRYGSFDVVIAANLLHLCQEPHAVVEALARLLRPGGRLLLCWPTGHTGPWRVLRVERSLGAGAAEVAVRLVVRMVVGLSALFRPGSAGSSPASLVDVVQAAAQRQRLTVTGQPALAGLQYLVVLNRPR